MNRLIAGFVAVSMLVIAGVVAYWWFDLRWEPRTIRKHQDEIAKILEQSGWVSPGLTGPKVYIVAFRSCPDCIRYVGEELPKLQAAGVDTRMVLVARRDLNGVPKSTPAERATVAELWINRSWALLERWNASEVDLWTAEGVPPADGDMARTAVVGAGRDMVEALRPLLAANGVPVGDPGVKYPTLIWWDAKGVMRAQVCEDPRTYAKVRKELGLR
jgi:hypothetical protein